jgi:hypothetical protein
MGKKGVVLKTKQSFFIIKYSPFLFLKINIKKTSTFFPCCCNNIFKLFPLYLDAHNSLIINRL